LKREEETLMTTARDWLWKRFVLIPLIIGLFFLSLLGIVETLDICEAKTACKVVGTIALSGVVTMLTFVVLSLVGILVYGIGKALASATHRSGPTNAHTA
jgi:hypothetical protein